MYTSEVKLNVGDISLQASLQASKNSKMAMQDYNAQIQCLVLSAEKERNCLQAIEIIGQQRCMRMKEHVYTQIKILRVTEVTRS